VKTRLSAEVDDPEEVAHAFRACAEELAVSLAVDRTVTERAIELREASRSRLPLVDSVIAATASCQSAILVHCDPHLAGIPKDRLRQRLVGPSDRNSGPGLWP
jgi:predicted nucleic acid-binding protein